MTFDHRFSCIATIKNDSCSLSMEVLKCRFFSSVGLVKFLFGLFCLLLIFLNKFMLPINEIMMNIQRPKPNRLFGILSLVLVGLLLPPPRRLCFYRSWLVSLLAALRKNYRTDFIKLDGEATVTKETAIFQW